MIAKTDNTSFHKKIKILILAAGNMLLYLLAEFPTFYNAMDIAYADMKIRPTPISVNESLGTNAE